MIIHKQSQLQKNWKSEGDCSLPTSTISRRNIQGHIKPLLTLHPLFMLGIDLSPCKTRYL